MQNSIKKISQSTISSKKLGLHMLTHVSSLIISKRFFYILSYLKSKKICFVCKVAEARFLTFLFFSEKTGICRNNRAFSKTLYGIFHYLVLSYYKKVLNILDIEAMGVIFD